jgi:pyruvate formate lyase activating enzyme
MATNLTPSIPPVLARHSQARDDLCRTEEDGVLRCVACAHRCRVPEGGHGVCGMRFVQDGKLRVPFGYVSSLACDPIEKKPLYHFLPGSEAVSFGMLGCNFHCSFCQNWTISQTGRDEAALAMPQPIEAAEIVRQTRRLAAPVIASTYNEPLITTEWSLEIFRLAKAADIRTCYVSNGFASSDALDLLEPWLDAINIDLKCFRDASYRELGGRLQPVLDTIRRLVDHGVWVEATTLVVPGFNDSPEELAQCAEFLAATSPDIPWHLSAYHASYQWNQGPERTPLASVRQAVEIGRSNGLHHVYAGNVPSDPYSDTRCPHCNHLVLGRRGFHLYRNELDNGTCPACSTTIAGVWE